MIRNRCKESFCLMSAKENSYIRLLFLRLLIKTRSTMSVRNDMYCSVSRLGPAEPEQQSKESGINKHGDVSLRVAVLVELLVSFLACACIFTCFSLCQSCHCSLPCCICCCSWFCSRQRCQCLNCCACNISSCSSTSSAERGDGSGGSILQPGSLASTDSGCSYGTQCNW